ncbi:MAG TPA: polysaccharide biosynthesis tyrosine autokinase, partial [Blastocatellia bacterium]|nr:polysaccharide biosynthesis tyrosine autokinase [Blastocatellia bacterium]
SDSAFLARQDQKPVMQVIRNLFKSREEGPDPSAQAPSTAPPASDSTPPSDEAIQSLAGTVDGGLAVDLVPNTRAIRISYTHTNPKEAAAVANQVAKSFMDLTFNTQTSQFTHTSEWLDRSTRELKARVEAAEQALNDYTKTHNIFSTDSKDTLTTDKLTHLHDQYTRAQTDRILKQSLYEEVKAGHIAQLPETYLDSRLGALRQKLEEFQSESADLSVKYGPKNPKVIDVGKQLALVQEQLTAATQSLEGKLEGDYERAVADEKSLGAALDVAKSEAVKENQDEIQFSILKQDVDTAKGLYTDFLQKTNQANLQVAEQHSNMHVIQPALVPGSPVGPKRTMTILMAFLLSLGGGVGLTFFLEYLDNTIKSVEDVSRYVQLPALGVIPVIAGPGNRQVRGKHGRSQKSIGTTRATGSLAKVTPGSAAVISGQLVSIDNHSSAAEAYRSLRTSVLLSSAGHPPKILLVTSGQPGEGKTTTVVNTAISLAQLGSEVLIIDADLRRPNIHKVFNTNATNGLSSYLSRDVDVDTLIQKQQFSHLSILPSGPVPPNPTELISSDRMRDLLGHLSERYDHILIDSPPLINVTDPVILSTMVDGVVLVISWGKSTRDTARRVRAELIGVGAKIFGVVLNNVDFRRDGYDDYYYYRYYTDYSQGKDAHV